MGALLLAITLLAAVDDPLAGCTISEPQPGDRAIQCKGLLGSVSHGPASIGPEGLLDAAIGGVKSGYKGAIVTEPATLMVRGKPLAGVRYIALHPTDKTPVLIGRLFALPHPTDPKLVRVFGCGASTALVGGEKSCDAILLGLTRAIPAPTRTSP